jgi:hypothetical protein
MFRHLNMQNIKKIFFVYLLLFLAPLVTRADVPDFPMSFYGGVTINGAAAAVGTVVRAYYGSILAGEVTVTEAGVYGSAASTAQKLLVANGTGVISFTVIAAAINGGVETGGTTSLTYPGFVTDGSVNLDLPFIFTTTSRRTSSGGGGGGGGSSASKAVAYVQVSDNKISSFSTADLTKIKSMDVSQFVAFLMTYFGSQPAVPAKVANQTISSAPVTASTPVQSTPPAPKKPVSLATGFGIGDTSPDVQTVQRYLNANGYPITDSGAGSRGKENSYFGGLTKKALMKFQKDNGLPATGFFGPKTKKAMFGDF